jgi:uncharacterized coiled-coil protein SlyX
MAKKRMTVLFAAALVCFAVVSPFPADAAEASKSDIGALMKRLEPLEALIKSQQKEIDAQNKKLADQQRELREYKAKLNSLASESSAAKKTAGEPKAVTKSARSPEPVVVARESTTVASTVSRDPEKETRPEISVLPDAGGVLTPKGVLMYENSTDYTNTTTNIFTFDGVQVSQVVLIGNVNASSARRHVLSNSSRFRMGLTNRLEADVRVPYVYRNDATSTTQVGGGTSKETIEGHGIGDIDMGLAYQINEGRKGWPYFVGNLRYKTNTGEGPYDVPYDANNVATRLPTGTGFNSVEGSVTMIKVTDPAVLFGNVGYVYSMGKDFDKTFNTTNIRKVDPGSVVNASGGLGFSVNQDMSFTLGYKHSFVLPTDQTAINTDTGETVKTMGDTFSVGALIVGASYRLSPTVNLNFTTEVGATRDAPDVRLGLRIPVQVYKFY